MELIAQKKQPIQQGNETQKAEAISDFSVTLSEYVEREATSAIKHEFHNGKLTEMAGGTPLHSQIGLNIGTFINICLYKKTERFIAYNSDAHIYIPSLDKSMYADVSVVQGDPILFKQYKTLIINPLLIIEVLSEGTESYDRNEKFEFYQNIPTFKEYVLVHQNQPKIESYYCKNGKRNVWQYAFETDLMARFKLQSVGCTLRLQDIYRHINF